MSSPIDRIRPLIAERHTVGEVAARFELVVQGAPDVEIWSVALDNRTVTDGDLFVALPGARAHGANFAVSAVERGARAVLTDAQGARLLADVGVPILVAPDPREVAGIVAAFIYGNPADPLTTFAVTGTNGKTTTTYFLDHALRALGRRTGLIGTVEMRSGDRVLPSRLTTPESVDLQALLAAMREDGVQTLAMEVSSHALALHRVDGIVFDVVGFTNLSQDHLDFHADLESYFAAKAALFTPARARRGVVLVDDLWGRKMAAEAAIPVATLATRADAGPADWTVTNTHASSDGIWLTLTHTDGRELTTAIEMPGAFNIANAALALAMVLEAGADVRDLAEALASGLRPVVPGRMEDVSAGGRGPAVLVDFAHNPDALTLALDAVRPSTGGSVVVVFGATGQRDTRKRPIMGQIAAERADVVIVTDDDPHDEDPAQIRADVLAGALAARDAQAAHGRSVQVREVTPRARAIREAVLAAGGRDTVLVAGRGHETIQEIAGVDHLLDDRVEARAALAAWISPPSTDHPSMKEHHA